MDCPGLSDTAGTPALDYVEGFHAADSSRVSVHSLARAEAAAEADEGNRQFRLTKGYAAMLDWLQNQNQLNRLGVELRLGAVVESVHWERANVEVETRTRAGCGRFGAQQLLEGRLLPRLRIDDNRHRPVVGQADEHVSAEPAGLDWSSEIQG